MRGREQTMHRVRSSTTKAVRTPRRLRSLWRLRVGAVAGLGLATTVALLPSGPAFGAGVHHRRPDPPLQVAHIVSLASGEKPVLSKQPADYIPATIGGSTVVIDPRSSVGHTDPSCQIPPEGAVVNTRFKIRVTRSRRCLAAYGTAPPVLPSDGFRGRHRCGEGRPDRLQAQQDKLVRTTVSRGRRHGKDNNRQGQWQAVHRVQIPSHDSHRH